MMQARARFLSALLLVGAIAPSAQAATFYGGNTQITRAEFVRLTLERTGGSRFDGTHCFTDVAAEPFAPNVCAAKQRGIVTGHPDGSFRPHDSISFIEAAAIAVRASDTRVTPDYGIWYRPYLEKVADWNAIPDSIGNILASITVNEADELLEGVVGRDDDDDEDDEEDDDTDEFTLTVSAEDDEVGPGDTVTYRIRIKNNGNSDEEVDVRAELDSDMEYVSASDGGSLRDDDEVEWEEFEVEEGDRETILLTVKIDEHADDGDKLRLKVTLISETSSVTNTVTVEDDGDGDADLRLTVTDSKDPVREGDYVTYTIRLENTGTRDMWVDVKADLDDAMEFRSASDGGEEDDDTVEWDDIRVREDEEETLTLLVRITDDADDGDTLELRVRANEERETEETEVDDDGKNDDEDVTITITEDEDPVEPGDRLTYTIKIQNRENDDITIDVRAFLDSQTSFLSATGGGDLEGDDEVLWEDIEIDEDETKTLKLEVRVKTSADDGDELELRVEAGDDDDTEKTEVEE